MEEREKVVLEWESFIDRIAETNKISKCQAESIAIQGLLFLDEMDSTRGIFAQAERAIVQHIYDHLAMTCFHAR